MSESSRYSIPQIAIHRLMVLLIFVLFVVGLSVDFFDKPWRPTIINLHALGGLLVLLLMVPRLLLRFSLKTPPYPANMGPIFVGVAKLGHAAMYAMMVLVPLIGIPVFLLHGNPLNLFFTQIPSPFEANHDLSEKILNAHEWAAYALIALAIGHALTATFHQYVLRDNLFARIDPATK
jgi:cytochrome b561